MSSRTKTSTLQKLNGNISKVKEKTKTTIRSNGITTDRMKKTKIPISKTTSKKEDIGTVRGSYASSSTVPEIPPIINTETVTRRETHRNILGGEWDREKWFDINGGTLTKEGSSVELFVPENAVSKAHISGKVFTDVNIFYSKFKLRETERPVSPIVEFVQHNKVKFDLHLRVKIPIVFKSQSDKSFRVLSISGGDKVESIPLADTSDKETYDVYYEVREGNIFVFTKHFTSFICASCSSNLGFNECFLFGSRHPYQTAGKSEVRLVIYLCDGLFSIKDFRKSLCDTEKECSRDFWDRTQIHTGNSDLDDTICSSIELTTESARDWKIKTRSNGSELFRINPQRLRDIQGIETPVVGKWTLTTTEMDALFECHIDIDLKHGNDLHTCTTFDVTKDSTVKIQDLPEKCINGSDSVNDILMNTLNKDNARDLARKMNMKEPELKHILSNYANDARECVRQIVSDLQGIHGPGFNDKLIPSLKDIGRCDVMEDVIAVVGVPFQGLRKRPAERTEDPPCPHSSSKKKN